MRRRCLLILVLLCLSACGGNSTPTGTAGYVQALRRSDPGSVPDVERLSRYHIVATVDPESSSVSGSASVQYVNTAPAELREVYLRLYPNLPMYGGVMRVLSVTVDGSDVPYVIGGKNVDLKVPLPRTLPTGRSALIAVRFSLTYDEIDSDFGFFGAKDGVIILPDFHPVLASLIEGEWRLDTSPGYGDVVFAPIALQQMDITVPAGYVAMSGGTVSESERSGESVTYHIAGGLVRNTSLVVARGYERQELAAGDVTLVSYAPESHRTAARAALTHAAAALSFFDDRLGVYPMNTITFIAVPIPRPDTSGGGTVLLHSALYGEQLAMMEEAVVRGVSRQWWGLSVVADPIRDPWIDESLSLYCSSLYLRQTHGAGYRAAVEKAWRASYEEAVSNNLDGPLSQTLSAYGNSARYEWLVQSKGPLFWAALEDLLGANGLLTLLRQLQDGYLYGSLDTGGVNDTVTRLVGEPGTALVDTWVLGSR